MNTEDFPLLEICFLLHKCRRWRIGLLLWIEMILHFRTTIENRKCQVVSSLKLRETVHCAFSIKHMLGFSCGRLYCPNMVLARAFSLSHHFYPSQVIYRNLLPAKPFQNSTAPCLPHLENHRSCAATSGICLRQVSMASFRRLQCHYRCSSLSSKRGICTTMWRSRLPPPFQKCFTITISGCNPSRHSLENFVGEKRRIVTTSSVAGPSFRGNSLFTFRDHKISLLPCEGTEVVSQRIDIAAGLCGRPWSIALDVKLVHWLYMRHSGWLLFGVCACFCAAVGVGSPAYAEPVVDRPDNDHVGSEQSMVAIKSSHGKKVHTNYSVIGIPGDGRCLFRSVVHCAQLRSGKRAPSESLEREYADELREKVVDELVKRREETEWFIEGNFDTYTKRMRQPHVWGGEPELLMASHVLKLPINVYMFDEDSGGLISIAEYGQQYGKGNSLPIRVLYHGFGHYDALQFPTSAK